MLKRKIKVAVVGDVGVGKTSIVNCLAFPDGKMSRGMEVTRGISITEMEVSSKNMSVDAVFLGFWGTRDLLRHP